MSDFGPDCEAISMNVTYQRGASADCRNVEYKFLFVFKGNIFLLQPAMPSI